ncbi:MAG: hypothetical protein KNN14_03240 [Aquificota bacterium]|nr:MAG: hypothetical protein KNN14_03240 [Aquificota bacterium]
MDYTSPVAHNKPQNIITYTQGKKFPSIKKRIYRVLREYQLFKFKLTILVKLLYGKKIELVIDGTIVDITNVNRART